MDRAQFVANHSVSYVSAQALSLGYQPHCLGGGRDTTCSHLEMHSQFHVDTLTHSATVGARHSTAHSTEFCTVQSLSLGL